MKTLEKVSDFVGKYMAAIVIVVAALALLFHLPTELAIGVILVGTCPGGTSSNVMTYLSKGDVALSVGMTAVSTVLAPFLTPLLTLLYAGQRVDVNPVNMFLSIVKVPCNFHRGQNAELRSGHLSGCRPLCTVSAGNHPRRCVLCVA